MRMVTKCSSLLFAIAAASPALAQSDPDALKAQIDQLQRQIDALHYLSSFGDADQQLRLALEACSFVEETVQIEEAFGVVRRGVGKLRHNFVAFNWSRSGAQGRQEGGGQQDMECAATHLV